jgi:hypothetical protein
MLKRLLSWAIVFLILLLNTAYAHAEILQSNSYIIDESAIGAGGQNEASSANYQGSNATGSLSIGNATSGNFQVEAGSKTTPDPALSFTINSYNANFGSFSPTEAAVTTAVFSISNYTSYGYVVQIVGNPPSNGSHTISAMGTTGGSQNSIEQFGINLVANTLPKSVGANPNNGQFGFGSVATNYSTANQYRYVSGETIALAPKSSGITAYTISYLVNVSSITPGGQYTSNQTLIVTGTY